MKLDELRTALAEEKERRAEILQKLEASENRVGELEKETEADASSVDRAEYDEVVRKAIKYKTAFRKSKAVIEGLTSQKAEMSQLATEYLSAAKILRRDLDHQLQASQELKSKLTSNAGSSGQPNQADLNRLVEKRARAYVLKLKSQFEARLKEKNDLIRKLQDRKTVES